MSTPDVAPGWYPDPSGQPGQRYHDGQRWTQHFTPMPPVVPASATAVALAVNGGGGSGGAHAVHAILTLLTCGLWLPIWLIFAIVDALHHLFRSHSGGQIFSYALKSCQNATP